MQLTQETITILAYLIPGFLFQKVLHFRCPLKEAPYQYFVIDSLLWSLVIYAIALPLGFGSVPVTAKDIGFVLGIAFFGGLIWSEVIKRDWLSKVLTPIGPRPSSHYHIFPVKGIEKFKEKWHLVGLGDGMEICGIIREFNVETHELLLERGRMVLPNGTLAKEEACFYLPTGNCIRYIRTLEENKNG